MSEASNRLVVLKAGDTALELAPAIGGAVARFSWRGVDLFRPATAAAIARGDVLGMGNFPLVPFAGRIHRGRFSLNRREVRLPVNLAGETDAIHGHGWQAPWTIAAANEATATLRYDHAAGDWPWAYRAEQTFDLTDRALTQRLSVTNLSAPVMPAGLGLHPYFPRRAGVRLRARVDGVFLHPDHSPTPPPERWDWRSGPNVDAFVDNQFCGWDGLAQVIWHGESLSVAMTTEPAATRLVVYAPTGEDYFCVEPVSHQLNAVNRSPGGAQHGMFLLASGETLDLTVRFTLASAAQSPP